MARTAGTYMKPSRRSKKLKRRDCLRCDREFWSEGPHHRLCQICRQVIAASSSPVEEYSVLANRESGTPDLWQTGRV
jgi:5-methylcytosine-specific restriction endonuclease McrA